MSFIRSLAALLLILPAIPALSGEKPLTDEEVAKYGIGVEG